jgi:hypothetical protein
MLGQVPRVIVELCEDIRFEEGSWVPSDERTAELVDGLARGCSTPRRLFSRAAAALDIEHIALCDAARRAGEKSDLPDLNLFYLVDGDPQALATLPLVRAATEVPPLPEPAAPREIGGDIGGALLPPPGDGLLADALDRAAALLGSGETLVVPYPLLDPASRAAATVAARRGVRVLTPDGKIGTAKPVARSAKSRVTVRLEAVTLVAGGDRGDSEIYIEGWVDDGVRRRFRIPAEGARTGVRRGAPERFDAPLYEGVPLEQSLIVHLEVWEEDLGRTSLIDPDDLIGVHERRFTAAERWGEGRHEGIRVATEDGEALVSYVIRQTAC